MIRSLIVIIYLLLLFSTGVFAQKTEKTKKVTLNGYISGVYTGMSDFKPNGYKNGGLLHNRLNFRYHPTQRWEVAIDLRTRAIAGDAYGLSPITNDWMTQDNGLVDLSWNIVNSNKFLLNTAVERFYVGYQASKFSIRLGRQRINWSQTMVFNPNDIFNTYSYFDFDYPERSGSDALRLAYYPSPTSTAEFVFKMDGEFRATAVGFYRGNVNGWDIQGLGGLYNSDNIIVGGGFSGTIGGLINLRGETTYYYDTKLEAGESRNTFLVSLGADYIFPSSLTIAAEFLYNSMPDDLADVNIFSTMMSSKMLSINPFTATTQVSYQFLPILDGAISAIYYIDMPALYVGLSLNVSIVDNLVASAMTQFFAQNSTANSSSMCLLYVRLKYNF